MSGTRTRYTITHSLYFGRARSYLIKNQISFQELSTGHESFKADGLLRPATTNRVLGGFITSFSQYIASYINNIAGYKNYCASICLKLPPNCASGGFREQLNQSALTSWKDKFRSWCIC